jgi:MFS family permease
MVTVAATDKQKTLAVLVGALGYFVDIYDLILFSIVRVPSLKALGVPETDILDVGVTLINWQSGGLLLGGLLWGIAGDKRGRKSILLGSILLYSTANIANAFVGSPEWYAVWRFVAGIGLAGELGAAVTLVSETLSKEKRGYGTMIVASFGLLGGVVAGWTGDWLDWRTNYLIGGGLGFLLLFLRSSLAESPIFQASATAVGRRGDLRLLFANKQRAYKYLCCILIGVPIWFVFGVLITFAPEFAKLLGVSETVAASRAVLYSYVGIAAGDVVSGYLSQKFESRKKVVLGFLLLLVAVVALHLRLPAKDAEQFYWRCGILGFLTGYWAVFATIAAEQFGTNLRATVAVSAPNFVRGSLILLTFLFSLLKPTLGVVSAAEIIGLGSVAVALLALAALQETFARDLNFIDE